MDFFLTHVGLMLISCGGATLTKTGMHFFLWYGNFADPTQHASIGDYMVII
jgi:hypothetical protein